MADITTDTPYAITRGDADDIAVTVVNTAKPPVTYDLSASVAGVAARPAVVRFTVRKKPESTTALILKTTMTTTLGREVEILPQSGSTKGRVNVYLDHPDTDLKPDNYAWDLEVTRQGSLRTAAGTATATSGSLAITGAGTLFLSAKAGDVLHFLGGANSGRAFLIAAIASDVALTLEPCEILSGAGAFEIRRGFRKTPLRGTFSVGVEVTK